MDGRFFFKQINEKDKQKYEEAVDRGTRLYFFSKAPSMKGKHLTTVKLNRALLLYKEGVFTELWAGVGEMRNRI